MLSCSQGILMSQSPSQGPSLSELDLPTADDSLEKHTPTELAQAAVVDVPTAASLELASSPAAAAVLTGPAFASLSPPVPPPVRRKFTDTAAIRRNIYDKVLQAARDLPPVANQRHTLRLTDVDYQDPEYVSKKQQKQAILNNLSQSRRLRGTWELVDNETQEVVDRKPSVIARVPYLTERGTFINNGVEYALKNQQRLLPGVYTRRQENGEVESHINPKTGTGPAHRFFLEPEKGVFKIKVGQGTVGLLPLLKIMGVPNSELQQAWGTDLYTTNQKSDSAAEYTKLRSKFLNETELKLPIAEQDARLREKFAKMELDPFVTRSTLGVPYENMSPQTVLAVTRKLAGVAKGEAETDDRDSLAYQQFFGPEDLFAERIKRDKDNIRRNALWRMSNKGNLKGMPTGLLTPQLQSALLSSGLGLSLEEINPTEILDKLTSTTRMGEGGIASADAIPAEARSVQPSMLNFIDPLRTPESARVGIDTYTARGAMKGDDGKLYSLFTDVRTGEDVYKSPQDITELTIGFPGALRSKDAHVPAMRRGKMQWVEKSELDLVVPNMEEAMNPLSNLIPMKSQTKGQRIVMASRVTSQALPLVNAEAPLVQSAVPGTAGIDSFESAYGNMLGAMRADKPGQVMSVTADEMQVRYEDGTIETHELYNQFPFNRKTYIHQTPLLQPGDTFAPGQLLAKSNYTDSTGAAALGLNARTAYMARDNFEDAITISSSFAERLKSEHMYQHQLDTSNGETVADKKKYVQAFPGTFDKSQLANIDNDGMVKPGTEVKFGDPLVLGISPKVAAHNRVHKKSATGWTDSSVTWDHHDPGVVTDTVMTGAGPMVVVKSHSTMQVGDKLCYDPETKLLTKNRGWVSVAEVTLEDQLATMNPATEELEWNCPTHIHKYDHTGLMYQLVTKHLDMLVTPNHNLWAKKRGSSGYQAVTAEELFNSDARWQFKKDMKWKGEEQPIYFFPVSTRKYSREGQVLSQVAMDDWLQFLGFYIAEGWCQGNYVKIGQYKSSPYWSTIKDLLDRIGLKWRYSDADGRFEIGNVWLAGELVGLGDSYTKHVPEFIQELTPRQIRIFLFAYLCGDGSFANTWEYSTSSEKLAYDVQLLCVKLGWSVRVVEVTRTDNWSKERHWRGRINKRHLRPWRSKKHIETYPGNIEKMVPYEGTVHCVTVPNHILFVSRGGKTYLSLNSGRYG